MSSFKSFTLRASATVASLLVAAIGPAIAETVPLPLSTTAASSTALKHLPAGSDEMTFRGETAHRSWSLYLARGEIERAKVFQLALKNTVVLMPGLSSVKLAINGHLLATVPARSAGGLAVVSVAIPAGVLVPGFNAVDVSVAMAHRVDCSVAATYELWTLLDPVQTGLVVPATPPGDMRSIDDIAGESLAEDGTTRITLRMTDLGDAAAIGRAGLLIDALVDRAGLVRPVVRVDPDGGRGPGFDVVITKAGPRDGLARNLRILGREDGLTFARDPANGRLVLILSGTDDADLDRQISAIGAKGSRVAFPSPAGQMIVDGEMRRSFGDLGLSTDSFSGRHYTSDLDVVLPSDFYPANYDKAQLFIDSSYSANLDPDSDLVFRVNGALVSSLRLGPDRGGVLQHEIVDLPLRFFHPGHNQIALEALTSTSADRQCDTASMSHDVRFTLSGTSEIAFPRFAHLGTIPQIPGAMAGSHQGGDRGTVDLYLPETDAASVGSGLTMLANMAVGRHSPDVPAVHLGPPANDAAPGMVVGLYEALPAALRAEVRARMTIVSNDTAPALANDGDEKAHVANRTQDGTPAILSDVGVADGPPQGFGPRAWMAETQHLLKNQGFFFGSDERAKTVPMSAQSLVVAAVDPRPQDHRLAGLNLPRFTTNTAQWLVVTAATGATLQEGLTRLVSDGQWAGLDGQAVSLDLQSGQIASIQPSRVLYVAPSHLVLSDVRPILGGIISNHIELGLAVLILLMATLGVSTHALIRRMGSK